MLTDEPVVFAEIVVPVQAVGAVSARNPLRHDDAVSHIDVTDGFSPVGHNS
jgi:hypothetical protein